MPSSKGKVRDHPLNAGKKAEALEMVIQGVPLTAIARVVGVRRETIGRWRAEPEFQAELQERRDEIRDAVHDRVLQYSVILVDQLYEVAVDRTQNGMARVRAVQAALEALGIHKGRPAAPVERKIDVETEEDLVLLLQQVPEGLLRRVLEERQTKRELA